jgi:hypothetical protein
MHAITLLNKKALLIALSWIQLPDFAEGVLISASCVYVELPALLTAFIR